MSIFKKKSKMRVCTIEHEDGISHMTYADMNEVGDPYEKEDLLVAFIIPTLDGQFNHSILPLWTRVSLKVKHIINCISEETFIDRSRNRLIDIANQIGAKGLNKLPDYYLFIDQDSVVHPELFEELRAKNKDIVSANCLRKKSWIPAWTPMSCVADRSSANVEKELRKIKKGAMAEALTVGCGALLVKGEVLRKIKPPWFKIQSSDKVYFGEDIWFCQKAREAGYKVWVATDIPIGHFGAVVYPSDWEQRGRKSRKGHEAWEI